MNKDILKIITCPKCKKGLEVKIKEIEEGDIKEGFLKCYVCKKSYPVIEGMPVFKVGLYEPPVVRVKNLSVSKIREKILEAQKGTYFKNFIKQIKDDFKKEYRPKGVIQNKLLKGLLDNSGVKKSKIHLDWATGRGGLLRYILKNTKNLHIITIDLDIKECAAMKKYISETWSKRKIDVICGDTREMPFKNNVFDSITTLWGIDEQREADRAVKETWRVLKNGKKFALSGGFEEMLFEQLKKKYNERISQIKSHLKTKIKTLIIPYNFIYKNNKIPVLSYIIFGKK